jgi:hypothetical protein
VFVVCKVFGAPGVMWLACFWVGLLLVQCCCLAVHAAVLRLCSGHSGAIRLLGISTVAGNMPVAHTTANALKTLYVAGLSHIRTCRVG